MRLLSPVAASNSGSFVMRNLGPWLPASQTADANLRLALPDLDTAERRQIIRGVWGNLGRVAAELPHLASLRRTSAGPGWECADDTDMHELQTRGGPDILFSGHVANWEVGFPVAASLGLDVSWFYRAAKNPVSDRIIQGLREQATGHSLPMFAKGSTGARAALAHLRAGGLLGMLVDQKLNEGISVPFFAHDAMTAPLLAQFALRFRCPVIPIHPVRLGPARYQVICDPPLILPDTGNRAADVRTVMVAMNTILERWIREQPESWLWLHKRWPKQVGVPQTPAQR